MEIIDKDELDLFNYLKSIKENKPKNYFDILFDFVNNHRKRPIFKKFLKRIFEEMLHLAKHQLEFVTNELEKIEQEKNIDKIYQKRYLKLKKGFYCSLPELDEMLEYFTKIEAYEQCSKIIDIKDKYYATP